MLLKEQKDLEKGDIIRVEFGDYGNFVTVVIDEVENHEKYYCKLKCHYLESKKPEVMFGRKDDLIEVLGKEQ